MKISFPGWKLWFFWWNILVFLVGNPFFVWCVFFQWVRISFWGVENLTFLDSREWNISFLGGKSVFWGGKYPLISGKSYLLWWSISICWFPGVENLTRLVENLILLGGNLILCWKILLIFVGGQCHLFGFPGEENLIFWRETSLFFWWKI